MASTDWLGKGLQASINDLGFVLDAVLANVGRELGEERQRNTNTRQAYEILAHEHQATRMELNNTRNNLQALEQRFATSQYNLAVCQQNLVICQQNLEVCQKNLARSEENSRVFESMVREYDRLILEHSDEGKAISKEDVPSEQGLTGSGLEELRKAIGDRMVEIGKASTQPLDEKEQQASANAKKPKMGMVLRDRKR